MREERKAGGKLTISTAHFTHTNSEFYITATADHTHTEDKSSDAG